MTERDLEKLSPEARARVLQVAGALKECSPEERGRILRLSVALEKSIAEMELARGVFRQWREIEPEKRPFWPLYWCAHRYGPRRQEGAS